MKGKFTRHIKTKEEEENILNFVFEDEFLKLIYFSRSKDCGEQLSIDGGKIFLSEFKSKNGEDFNSSSESQIPKVNLSSMKIGLNTIFSLTKFVKKSKQIKCINLANNLLKDQGVYNLKEFLKASQISSINLASNMITAAGVSQVAEILCKLSSLKYVNLGVVPSSFAMNNLGLEGARALKNLLSSNQSLETLVLEENGFDKQAVCLIAEGLALSQLKRLVIRRNGVSSKGFGRLLAAGAGLQRLDVSGNRIKNRCFDSLSAFFSRPNALECLSLSENLIDEGALDGFSSLLRNGNHLQELKLKSLDLSRLNLQTLINLLSNRGLKRLDLSGCRLSERTVYSIFSSLHGSGIEKLVLSHNAIGPSAFERRAFDCERPALRGLCLSNCGLDDHALDGLLRYLKRFAGLVKLDVSNNLLTEDAVASILQAIPTLPKLQLIALEQNRVNLQQRKEIHQRLGANKQSLADKRPKVMQRAFYKLVYEKENIEKLIDNIKSVEERIFKLHEQRKTAEIEFANEAHIFSENRKQIAEKTEKAKKVLLKKGKLLEDKQNELELMNKEAEKEINDLTEIMLRQQEANIKAKSELEKIKESANEAETKFEIEYAKKNGVVSEIMNEIGRMKTESDFYLERINRHMNLQKL